MAFVYDSMRNTYNRRSGAALRNLGIFLPDYDPILLEPWCVYCAVGTEFSDMYIYIYIYICVCIYIYICVCVCVCVCIKLSNPQPARFYYAARGRICKVHMYYIYKSHPIIKVVNYTNFCYFSTCGLQSNPQ